MGHDQDRHDQDRHDQDRHDQGWHDQGWIERYHQGSLSADEEAGFEEHFMGCAECQEQLVFARGLRRGMRAMATEDAVRQTLVARGIFAWLARRSRRVQHTLAAVVLLVALLPVAWLLSTSGSSAPDAEIGVSPSLLLLSAQRDSADEPAAVLDLDGVAAPIVLAVDAGADPRFDSYRIAIFEQPVDSSGAPLVRREGLLPNHLEVLMISFPSDYFPPGDYRLVVEGVAGDGSASELGGYRFRVVDGGS